MTTGEIRFPRDEGNGPYRVLRAFRNDLVERTIQDLAHPRAAQTRRLGAVLERTAGSAFGREHGLEGVRTIDDLRRAVPIRTHAEHLPWLDRVEAGEPGVLSDEAPSMLLETSGTTGRPKHLPVTPAWERSFAEAQAMWVLRLVQEFEAVATGKALTLVSPAEHGRTASGIPIGSNTGRMHKAQPWVVRLRYPVPYEAFCLEPSDLKLYVVLRFALQARVTSITTANPSTLLLLCRKLVEWAEPLGQDLQDGTCRHGPARGLSSTERARLWWPLRRHRPPSSWKPADIWPLAVVNCWKGGPAPFFLDKLPAALGGDVPVREVGVTASEGYFALPLSAGDGCVLWTGGHVLELVGRDGVARSAWELEVGERGRLVITTEAGLCRYDLDDMLEVVGRLGNTPVVRFEGKASRMLNITGEKVSEPQIAEAVRRAGRGVTGFTCRIALGAVPSFELAVEGLEPAALPAMLLAFDRALSEVNLEYATKRSSDRLGPPVGRVVPAGTYLGYRQRRVAEGAPDGQVKDPILALDDGEWARVVEPV